MNLLSSESGNEIIRGQNTIALALIMLLMAVIDVAGADDASTIPIQPEAVMIGQFEKNPALKVSLAADSSKISHPIAFSVDDFGRVFVAESFRYIDQRGGWTDIRWRMPWLQQDLASRSIHDRKKLYETQLGDELAEWQRASERVRLLQNPDKSGVYQKSTVFADGFNGLLDGTIAGLLATRDHVYVTNIPSLWRLENAGGDISGSRKPLHTGFGVRLGYLGHDLHGLCWGPDGRLYFSIGDRGANLTTPEGKTIAIPDTGGVFRCEADGSGLELFAKGLRNPQELAFDAYGNLWTCDNNADKGDKARWVWVVPGGDSGWRIGYQHLNKPVLLGAWTAEKMWYPAHAEQSGLIVPPVANLAQGPSGVAAHPGTGLSTEFTGQFLVCDYLGDGGGIYAVDVNRSGAGYEMQPPRHFLWRTPANDVDFAPDGSVLFTTWTGGIAPTSSGALYRVESAELKGDPLAVSTAGILALDPVRCNERQLGAWLEHPDIRVRRFAQFALVKRGKKAVPVFMNCIQRSQNSLARCTALWGLAQLKRIAQVEIPEPGVRLANDPDPEFKATLARVLADLKSPDSERMFLQLLKDSDDRVKFWACLGLAQAGTQQSVMALLHLAEMRDDTDPWLRHAISEGLAHCAGSESLAKCNSDQNRAVRRVAMLALAKQKRVEVAEFLNDDDPTIVVDSARAICELREAIVLKRLASVDASRVFEESWSEFNREAFLRRWLQANMMTGDQDSVVRLINLIRSDRFSEAIRSETMKVLANWTHPSDFDLIDGTFRPVSLQKRDSDAAKKEVKLETFDFLNGALPVAFLQSVFDYFQKEPSTALTPVFQRVLNDSSYPEPIRARSLEMLVRVKAINAMAEVKKAIESNEPQLRLTAIGSVASLPEMERLQIIEMMIRDNPLPEKQKAVQMLASFDDHASVEMLGRLVNQYLDETLPAGLRLDVWNAAYGLARDGRQLRQRLSEFRNTRSENDPIAIWRDSLVGGDLKAGQVIFETRAELSCVRCHQSASAETQVGPRLDDVGSRLSAEQILRSIVRPNDELAKGFETIVVAMKDGTTVTGLVQSENSEGIEIRTGEGKSVRIQKTEIEERVKGVSLMPEGLVEKLSAEDLRDLIAYLVSRKKAE